ncbi:uncharacterized protein [Neodiprion pinetum]|uniref:uncharacterized protein n=1 Tax=Neodiprion pinetum TaxID=441929 RepID=UPI001EE0F5B9|nr:uncharacterized protein LOC124218268 [Neodiprion pinetum]
MGNARLINNINTDVLPPLGDGQNTILFVTSANNLGVILDSKLTFRHHIARVTSRVNGVLYRRRQLPLLGTGRVNDTKLQRLANNGVRYIHNLPRDVFISRHRHGLGWLSVEDRRRLAVARIIYVAVSSEGPSFIRKLFTVFIPPRPSRHQDKHSLVIPSQRTDAYRSSLAVSGAYLWNSLPSSVTSSPSLPVFKDRLRSHILSLDPVLIPLIRRD